MPRRSKKQDRLCDERNASVQPIDKEWIKLMQAEMDNKHRIFYKKQKNKVEVVCSLTQKRETLYRKLPEDMFDMRKVMQQDPVHNSFGVCPICKKMGKFVSPGRAKKKDVDIRYYTLYDRWDEDGLVIRHIEVWRRYENLYSDCCGTKAYKEYTTEIARTFLKTGQAAQRDFHKHDWYGGTDFWDYKNLYGMANIFVADEGAKELNISLIREKPWVYEMDFYYQVKKRFYPRKFTKMDFLQRYVQYPETELMYKTGMKKLSLDILEGHDIKKYKGKRIWEQYGVTKEHWNYIREKEYGIRILKIFQWNDVNGYGCTKEQIEWIGKHIYSEIPKRVMGLTTPTKLINYITRQKGKDNGYESINTVYEHYKDYLDSMRQMGYDLQNTVYLFPKDLRTKHDEAARRLAVQQDKKKKEEKNNQYKNIAKNYEKLCKRYGYEKGDFIIRPADSAAEIIEEGRTLHHCVGGDTYLSSHNKGNSYILLMRKVAAPEISYCTIEIKKNKIVQWYQAHDKKPDKKIIQPWLDEYVEHLTKVKKMKEKKNGTDDIKLAAG